MKGKKTHRQHNASAWLRADEKMVQSPTRVSTSNPSALASDVSDVVVYFSCRSRPQCITDSPRLCKTRTTCPAEVAVGHDLFLLSLNDSMRMLTVQGARIHKRQEKDAVAAAAVLLQHNSATCEEALYHLKLERQATDGGEAKWA